jgi:CHASE3 domain sensor protein
MEPKLQEQINDLELKIEQIHEFTRKTERYMRWTFWVTIVVVVLPLIIAMFVVPMLIGEVMQVYSGVLSF